MKICAINGSPRKRGNTARLLSWALDGVKNAREDAETELINLYDLSFTGCRSCFSCKRVNGPSYGRCAVKDDLAPVLGKLADADGVILGSPVYFMGLSGMMRCFLERWLYPYLVYDAARSSIAPKRMATAMFYTMNVTEEQAGAAGLPALLRPMENFVERIFTRPYVLWCYDTLQFRDYSDYVAPVFDEAHKQQHREECFPMDLKEAFEVGHHMALGELREFDEHAREHHHHDHDHEHHHHDHEDGQCCCGHDHDHPFQHRVRLQLQGCCRILKAGLRGAWRQHQY